MSLVFLHGWGQSQQIWYAQKKQYPHACFLNLSGHGGRLDSDDYLQDVMQQCPEQPFTLLGWSLGGMLGIRLAEQYPSRIKGLVLVNSTPSFRQRDDWLHACDAQTFAAFEQGIATQASKTMRRFFALMFQGESLARNTYRHISEQALDQHHPPSSFALKQGLHILSTWDLRPILPHITQPTCVIHGQQDAVIPVQAGQYLAEHIPDADFFLIDKAGHAPLLTHSQALTTIVTAFLRRLY